MPVGKISGLSSHLQAHSVQQVLHSQTPSSENGRLSSDHLGQSASAHVAPQARTYSRAEMHVLWDAKYAGHSLTPHEEAALAADVATPVSASRRAVRSLSNSFGTLTQKQRSENRLADRAKLPRPHSAQAVLPDSRAKLKAGFANVLQTLREAVPETNTIEQKASRENTKQRIFHAFGQKTRGERNDELLAQIPHRDQAAEDAFFRQAAENARQARAAQHTEAATLAARLPSAPAVPKYDVNAELDDLSLRLQALNTRTRRERGD